MSKNIKGNGAAADQRPDPEAPPPVTCGAACVAQTEASSCPGADWTSDQVRGDLSAGSAELLAERADGVPGQEAMAAGPGARPEWPRLLGPAGYHSLRRVTSAALGQPPEQSIFHNLENQPSLQKQRGDIGNKDGYGI